MSWSTGKHAYGFCDRTGFRYPLKDLVHEFKNGQRTGLRIGRNMIDPDHPQNFLGRVKTDDPKPLRDPRPDTTADGLFGWNPVGNPATYARALAGRATVTIT